MNKAVTLHMILLWTSSHCCCENSHKEYNKQDMYIICQKYRQYSISNVMAIVNRTQKCTQVPVINEHMQYIFRGIFNKRISCEMA